MEALKTAAFAIALGLAAVPAAAGDVDWEDIFAPYRQRIDTATTSSGNAQDVNTVTQMITPWPPYVHNRRLSTDGARMVGAVERYRNPLQSSGTMQPAKAPPPAVPEMGGTPTNGAEGGGGGQPGAAEQAAPSGK
jgi:hypothetical protein